MGHVRFVFDEPIFGVAVEKLLNQNLWLNVAIRPLGGSTGPPLETHAEPVVEHCDGVVAVERIGVDGEPFPTHVDEFGEAGLPIGLLADNDDSTASVVYFERKLSRQRREVDLFCTVEDAPDGNKVISTDSALDERSDSNLVGKGCDQGVAVPRHFEADLRLKRRSGYSSFPLQGAVSQRPSEAVS